MTPLLIGLALAAAPAHRESIGQFGRWGVFRDAVPRRCWVVATPRDGSAAWLIVTADGRIAIEPGSARLTARVDGHDVAISSRMTGWSAGRLIAAMRTGERLRLRAVSGRRFDYPLAGFATAFDAARIACLPTG
jgi:hypothetical protein